LRFFAFNNFGELILINRESCIVKIIGLRKVYKIAKEKVIALNKIDLEIPRGEICCILGTSGSGKSTLLNMMAGLERPTKGEVYINGHNISSMSEKQLASLRRKYVGFIFQSYNLLPALTALENVALPLVFRGVPKFKRNIIAKKMIKNVGLSSRIKHKPSEMSGGQQQRAGIARAFAAKPMLVFADEPTGNLDSKTTTEIMEMMVKIARDYKQTLIIVTHDQSVASYADRIVTLMDGNIISDSLVQKS